MISTNIKPDKDSTIEITVSVPPDEFKQFIDKALTYFQNTLEIKGFRRGHIPKKIVRERVNQSLLLEKAAEEAVSYHYPRILREKKIRAIGKPTITVTKLAENNPLEFKAVTTTMPLITLPEYKKIACSILKKESKDNKKNITATEEEVMRVIEATRDRVAQQQESKKKDKGASSNTIPIDDAFAQSLGQFKNLDELKEKIRLAIVEDKKNKERDRIRLAILHAISEKTKMDVPSILINAELENMFQDFKHSIERTGIAFSDYLSHIKKDEDELKKEWYSAAEKRVRVNLVINAIIEKEGISVPHDLIEQETARLQTHYPNAHKEELKAHVHQILLYEKVYQLLESQHKS